MRFVPSVTSVEAEPFVLAGEDFFGVAVAGRAHAIPADVFRLFFGPEPAAATCKESSPVPSTDAMTAAVVGIIRSGGKKTAPAPSQKIAATASSKSKIPDLIRKAVAEEPRTTAETQDRVCVLLGEDPSNKFIRGKVYASIYGLLRDKTLVKMDDPKTNLPKLFLAGGAE
jgi:hypothetical protein